VIFAVLALATLGLLLVGCSTAEAQQAVTPPAPPAEIGGIPTSLLANTPLAAVAALYFAWRRSADAKERDAKTEERAVQKEARDAAAQLAKETRDAYAALQGAFLAELREQRSVISTLASAIGRLDATCDRHSNVIEQLLRHRTEMPPHA
jgi:hypothetical protein